MLGYSSIEELQDNFQQVIGKISYLSQEDAEKLKALRTKDGSVDYECIFNKGQADERYVIAKSKIAYSLNGRRIAHTTYVDATEMRALQLSVEKAEQAARAKSKFLKNISHDFRTPMNAIIGYTEILQAYMGNDERSQGFLAKLMESSKLLTFLLSNAIELSSFELGTQTLKESVTDTSRFLEVTDSVLKFVLWNRNLTFLPTINIQHQHVICDSAKIRMVILNVLGNAIKFTPTGGTISVRLEETPLDQQGRALFTAVVQDTGVGISPEFLPFVFDDFARQENSTESGRPGAGMGLSVAKKLLELMDGTIEIESKPGNGTKVTFAVPLRVLEGQELEQIWDNETAHANGLLRGSRVLLAEDNALNAEITTLLLSDAGLLCEHVWNGKEAVDAMVSKSNGYYDLVLMDIQMPKMDGYQAARAIRVLDGDRGTVPIIAFSANALNEDRRLSEEAGMNGHVAKPLEVSELLETLLAVKLRA